MVQNEEGDVPDKPRRGRPPAYDRDTALGRAGDAFWKTGYSATTLDQLSAATGMNRPSLYAAFGDKHAMYLAVMDRYAKASQDKLESFLVRDLPLRQQLMAVYDAALDIYVSTTQASRGCFLVGTALSEAVEDDAIRQGLLAALLAMDGAYERRFVRAKKDGEIGADADPRALSHVAAALLNALAVRARAGEDRETLRATAKAAVRLMCA